MNKTCKNCKYSKLDKDGNSVVYISEKDPIHLLECIRDSIVLEFYPPIYKHTLVNENYVCSSWGIKNE